MNKNHFSTESVVQTLKNFDHIPIEPPKQKVTVHQLNQRSYLTQVFNHYFFIVCWHENFV